MKGYGFFTAAYLCICLIITRLFFRGARLIRLPIFLRNRHSIKFGEGLVTGVGCRVDSINNEGHFGEIVIGSNVQLNDYCHIASYKRIEIGDSVLIASRVFISDHNHGCYYGSHQCDSGSIVVKRRINGKAVVIRDNVWLGEGVVVLPGVTIGENTIVGANSVVTRSLPANTICVGAPAIVVKNFCFNKKKWIATNDF